MCQFLMYQFFWEEGGKREADIDIWSLSVCKFETPSVKVKVEVFLQV